MYIGIYIYIYIYIYIHIYIHIHIQAFRQTVASSYSNALLSLARTNKIIFESRKGEENNLTPFMKSLFIYVYIY
jgi:hypothetical protein